LPWQRVCAQAVAVAVLPAGLGSSFQYRLEDATGALSNIVTATINTVSAAGRKRSSRRLAYA
jgi:hypothetical protein